MTPNRASLAARLAKLEERRSPRLALVGEIRVFDADGLRLNGETTPLFPGIRRAVVNVTIGRPLALEQVEVYPLPGAPAPPPAPAMISLELDLGPMPPAPIATPQPSPAAEGIFVLGRPGDQVVTLGEAITRAKLRGKGDWRGDF